MGGRHVIETVVFLGRAVPHLSVVRLVPDFPMADRIAESVRPSLGVVTDDMLANACPFVVVLGREDKVGLDTDGILDRDTETEIGLNARLDQTRDQYVGEVEIVAGGIVDVRIEIAEDVGNIHVFTAAEASAHVVQTGVRDARLGEIVEMRGACGGYDGRLTAAVHRLHRFDGTLGVELNGGHIHLRSAVMVTA